MEEEALTPTPLAQLFGVPVKPLRVMEQWLLDAHPPLPMMPLLEALVWAVSRNDELARSAWIAQRPASRDAAPSPYRATLHEQILVAVYDRDLEIDWPVEERRFWATWAACPDNTARGRRGGSDLVGGEYCYIPAKDFSGAKLSTMADDAFTPAGGILTYPWCYVEFRREDVLARFPARKNQAIEQIEPVGEPRNHETAPVVNSRPPIAPSVAAVVEPDPPPEHLVDAEVVSAQSEASTPDAPALRRRRHRTPSDQLILFCKWVRQRRRDTDDDVYGTAAHYRLYAGAVEARRRSVPPFGRTSFDTYVGRYRAGKLNVEAIAGLAVIAK